MSTKLLIVGNPVDGFQYHGPFNDGDAESYAERHGLDMPDWWVADLQDLDAPTACRSRWTKSTASTGVANP